MMLQGMRPHKRGSLLLVALALLPLSCRNSVPPKIEICIGDGVGGADCIEPDGTKMFRLPSQLQNYWMTSEADEANFSSWCYESTKNVAEIGMKNIKEDIHGPGSHP